LSKSFGDADANAGAANTDESDFVCELAGHGDFSLGFRYWRGGTFDKSGPSPSATRQMGDDGVAEHSQVVAGIDPRLRFRVVGAAGDQFTPS
jgi:hypothetical protein